MQGAGGIKDGKRTQLPFRWKLSYTKFFILQFTSHCQIKSIFIYCPNLNGSHYTYHFPSLFLFLFFISGFAIHFYLYYTFNVFDRGALSFSASQVSAEWRSSSVSSLLSFSRASNLRLIQVRTIAFFSTLIFIFMVEARINLSGRSNWDRSGISFGIKLM